MLTRLQEQMKKIQDYDNCFLNTMRHYGILKNGLQDINRYRVKNRKRVVPYHLVFP